MPTPRPPKGKSGRNPPAKSALDSEKSILQERQRQIDEKIEALNRTLTEANAPSGYRINGATARPGAGPLPPGADQRSPARRRSPKKVVLRAERQEGRLQTLALLIVVVALVTWALSRYL